MTGSRWLGSRTESTPSEFRGPNAYDLLGVSQTSSLAEIKASFHKLAKETHPDLADSHTYSSASNRFIQILAAYEELGFDLVTLAESRYSQIVRGGRTTINIYCLKGCYFKDFLGRDQIFLPMNHTEHQLGRWKLLNG